ncbi:hypothetical protein [Actinomadura sp. B10D3]|uniref:hypothetical protein n=1 Tax=Actinomadura sp. B10D3 TaxID=3153557 RepID=UPI00325F361A
MTFSAGPGRAAGPGTPDGPGRTAARPPAQALARRRFLRAAGAVLSGALAAVTLGGSSGTTDTRNAAGRGAGGRGASPPAPSGGSGPSRAGGDSLTDAEVALVLQVARVGAAYPAPFPRFGERGPATGRATKARLDARLPELSAQRLGQVREGAQSLISAGLMNAPRDALLDGIGARMAGTETKAPPGLTALLALAIATVSKKFDPHSDGLAEVWLGTVRRRHRRLKR